MKKLAKIFFIISAVAFALSLTGPGSEIAWGFLKPLSAVLFIAFFITNLLANEYAKYDEEQKAKLALATRRSISVPSAPVAGERTAESRTLTPATAK